MEFKFAPKLRSAIGAGVRTASGSPTSHAISGSTAASVNGYGSVWDPARGGWDVDETARRALERVIWVFRCVDVIASNQAKLNLVLRKGDPENGKIQAPGDLFKLLNQNANDYENSWQFRYRLSGQLLLSKRGVFVEVVRDGFGQIVELHLLPPHHVEPIPDKDTFVKAFRLTLADGSFRDLSPEKVMWLRIKPHPLDPYLQMTPLMAAGLAVDTDWLSRLFNANFLRNDGRPGLLIGVRGKMNTTDAKELKDRFGGGVARAGRVSVIEADDITVSDLAANPRDIQWLEGINGSKQDILLAFGVPESVMGNASGRTFDNADAELEVFWSETMRTHVDPLCRGLDPLTGDVNDDMYVAADYDKVAVLQRHREAREAKYMERVMAGLMTLDEFFKLTGKEAWDVPASRVLFLQNGVVVAKTPEDQVAVAALPILGQPAAPVDDGSGGAVGGALPQGAVGGLRRPSLSDSAQQGAVQGTLKGMRKFENIIAARAQQLSSINTRLALSASGKDLPVLEGKVIDITDEDGHPYADIRARYEGVFEGVLGAWSAMQGDAFADQLGSRGVKEGTRHWEGELSKRFVGMELKAIDPNKVVNVNRWTGDLKRSMASMMTKLVIRTVRDTANAMDTQGVVKVMNARGLGSPQGRSAADRVYGSTQSKEEAVSGLLTPLNGVVERAAQAQLERIKAKIQKMDADGASLTEIKREVSRMASRNGTWQQSLAKYLTTAIVEGAQLTTWKQAGDIATKHWNTVADERVRHTHRAVDGTERPIGAKFKVGKSWLAAPGDPNGSIEETAGCRCWLGFSISDKEALTYDELAS